MTTITKAFTAAGVADALSLEPDQSATYSTSGTWTGDMRFERSRNGGFSWEIVTRPAVDTNISSTTVKNETNQRELYRFRVDTDYRTDPENPIAVSGTCTAVVADVAADVLHEFSVPGSPGRVKYTDTGIEIPVLSVAGGNVTASNGDVVGPSSATNNGIVLFDGTTGKLVKSSAAVGTGAYEAAVTRATLGLATTDSPTFAAVNVGAGTVGAPSVTLGDTNTGLMKSADNAIGVVTDGVERWVYNASGSLVPAADSTYDIGNGLSDPRDVNVARYVISRYGIGAKNGATVTTTEHGDSVTHRTILTLTATPVTVANTTGASFGGLKLYDFPAGRIGVLGVTANLSFDWSGTTIAADGSGDFSLGTTITADATLDTTDVDLLPSTALTDPFVAGVGTGKGALAASAQFDGTTTAIDANINIIIDDVDVADAASDVVLVTGTITITWANYGDY